MDTWLRPIHSERQLFYKSGGQSEQNSSENLHVALKSFIESACLKPRQIRACVTCSIPDHTDYDQAIMRQPSNFQRLVQTLQRGDNVDPHMHEHVDTGSTQRSFTLTWLPRKQHTLGTSSLEQ